MPSSVKAMQHRWNPAGVRSFIVFMLVAAAVSVVSMFVQYRVISAARQDVVGDGRNVETYGFDLSHFALDRRLLVASGQPKGGLPALTNPVVINKAEIDARNDPRMGSWSRFIVSSDVVIGVTINGESRAYPLRILNWHEVVNDRVGGVPITVVWHSITKTAAVFERRVDGEEREFGFSGLLFNSSPVLYDKRDDPADESLWSPVLGCAVSGSAAGASLRLLPCRLARWELWRAAHPQTSSIIGEKRFKKRYRRMPFSDEFKAGKPLFPVEPMVAEDHPAGYHPWDTLAATRDDDGDWRVLGDAFDRSIDVPADQPTLFTSWYVWYAFYGDAGLPDSISKTTAPAATTPAATQ